MVRQINRTHSTNTEPVYQCIYSILVTSIPILLLAVCIALLFFYKSTELSTILYLAISELLLVPFISTIYRFFQAIEKPFKYGLIVLLLSLFRLSGVLVLYLIPNPTVSDWSLLHFFATFIVFVISLKTASSFININPKTIFKYSSFSNLFIATSFALSESSRMIHSDSDKTLLAKLINFNIAGQYSLAYRVIDLISLPIYTFIETATPRIYKSIHNNSTSSPEKTTFLLFAIPCIYSLALPFVVFYCADLIPILLGSKYELSSTIIIYLSLLPFLFLLRTTLRIMLVTRNDFHTQAKIEMLGGLSNILFSISGIVLFNWMGAIIGTIVAEIIMITMYFKQHLNLSKEIRTNL